MPDIDQDTGEINPHSTQGRILSALETLRTFPEAMAAAAVGIRDAMDAVRQHQKGAKVTISITVGQRPHQDLVRPDPPDESRGGGVPRHLGSDRHATGSAGVVRGA